MTTEIKEDFTTLTEYHEIHVDTSCFLLYKEKKKKQWKEKMSVPHCEPSIITFRIYEENFTSVWSFHHISLRTLLYLNTRQVASGIFDPARCSLSICHQVLRGVQDPLPLSLKCWARHQCTEVLHYIALLPAFMKELWGSKDRLGQRCSVLT